MLDFRVTTRAERHQEIFVVSAAGEYRDDMVGVVLVASARRSVFPAHFTFWLGVSSSFREFFPGFWGEEGADGGVEFASAGPVWVVFTAEVFSAVPALTVVVTEVARGRSSREFVWFSRDFGSAVGAFCFDGVSGGRVRVFAASVVYEALPGAKAGVVAEVSFGAVVVVFVFAFVGGAAVVACGGVAGGPGGVVVLPVVGLEGVEGWVTGVTVGTVVVGRCLCVFSHLVGWWYDMNASK